MPSRSEATELLARYGGDAAWTGHCAAVARAAETVGAALGGDSGIDLDALWSVALLHDIGRHATHDPILHGVEGYRLLTTLGHHDAAFVCASHVGFGLHADEAVRFGLPRRDFVPHTLEQRIVALADLLVQGRLPTTLEARIASLRSRNAGNEVFLPLLDRAHERAQAFMEELDRRIGTPVEELVGAPGGGS